MKIYKRIKINIYNRNKMKFLIDKVRVIMMKKE